MSIEGMPIPTAPEGDRTQVQIEALQLQFGMSADEARSVMNVVVICPDERGQGAETTFGEFALSDHELAKKAVVESYKVERGESPDVETALRRSLGPAGKKDPEDPRKLLRLTNPKFTDQYSGQSQDSKKK